jgi:hypothetical protein
LTGDERFEACVRAYCRFMFDHMAERLRASLDPRDAPVDVRPEFWDNHITRGALAAALEAYLARPDMARDARAR